VYRIHHKNEIVFLEALEQERIIFQYPYPALNLVPPMALAEQRGKAKPRRTHGWGHEWPTGREANHPDLSDGGRNAATS
jgi:hypothetical protein